jgi:conserved oligomeric Golgi complex subunit 6
MNVYQSSLLGDEDKDDQIAGFEKVLDTMIDPAIQMCINSAEQKKAVKPRWDMQVFVLNCLSYLLVGVVLSSFGLVSEIGYRRAL